MTAGSLSREAAWALMTEYTSSDSLRKHMLAVEAALRGYARKWGESEEDWGVVGLLHDFDYERWPDLENHPFRGVEILKATPSKIYLLVGDSPREVTWAQIPAPQVAQMAEAVGATEAADRLALGALCHHARASSLALRYLTSLAGTPFEEEARRFLQSTT